LHSKQTKKKKEKKKTRANFNTTGSPFPLRDMIAALVKAVDIPPGDEISDGRLEWSFRRIRRLDEYRLDEWGSRRAGRLDEWGV
jgi:hypothetical protein